MKHPAPFADFWLSQTHAYEVPPGTTIDWYCTSEEAVLPYRTATGRCLVVATSTLKETRLLHNGQNGAHDLPEWPWVLQLDELPMPTGYLRYPFTFTESTSA